LFDRFRFADEPDERLLLLLRFTVPLLRLFDEERVRFTLPLLLLFERVRFTVPVERFVELLRFTVPRESVLLNWHSIGSRFVSSFCLQLHFCLFTCEERALVTESRFGWRLWQLRDCELHCRAWRARCFAGRSRA
jgi:hypothetical protein